MLLLLACSGPDEAGVYRRFPPVDVIGLSWRLHDDVESLVHVEWLQTAPARVHVEYRFDDEWASTPSAFYEAGLHERLVVGIPYRTDAEWRVVVEDGSAPFDGDPIRTGRRPEGLPKGQVVTNKRERQLDAEYLLTSINQEHGGWRGGQYWTFITDRKGRVVWAKETPEDHWTLFAQVSVTGGYLLWDEQTYWSDFGDGEDSRVHKTFLDRQFEVVDTPGLHHEFVQLPDETLVWGSQAHGGYEALVEKGPTQPDETVLWTCEDDWPGASADCESNGLFYAEATDSLLYSFYTNSSIVEVDRATGESLWWAGEVPGGYTFEPSDAQFSWQHGISYTDAGTLLVSSEWGQPVETWLMEYEVDDADRSLRLLWSDSAETRANTNGQAWRLDNGNTLHIVGDASIIREVDPDGDDVWLLDFEGTRLLGAGEFIRDLYALLEPPSP